MPVSSWGAMSVVMGNMIGIGVFTSLGFQIMEIRLGFALLLLWVLGGIFALCAALSCGELAGALPRSRGEYNFLSRIYSPVVGFLSGWVAATVGFAAPVALMAMAFGEYFSEVISLPPFMLSGGVVLVTVAYVAVNAAFPHSTPLDAMEGELKVGLIAGREIFGMRGGEVIMIVNIVRERGMEALSGALLLGLGAIVYLVAWRGVVA